MALDYTALASNGTVLGWQSTQNTRGTWDIIWSSLQTIALCAWVSVCTNAARPEDGDWDIVRDKFFFVLLTLLGPEFILLLAFGQWQAARISTYDFRDAGFRDWTIAHSFYANMGGIHVRPPDFPSFPVDAQQLLYLLKGGHIELPPLTRREIEGLSKSDAAVKLITLVQALSYLATTAARLHQKLAVTTLEVTVVANIFCFLATYICWWNKPMDVTVIRFYDLKSSMEIIVQRAGHQANGGYRNTPLDFVSRQDWAPKLLWDYYVNILRRLGILLLFDLHLAPPVQRITTFDWPKVNTRVAALFLLVIGLGYTSFFLGAWNFYFPSDAERQLWRIVVLIQFTISLIGGGFEILMLEAPIRHAKPADRCHGLQVESTNRSATQALSRKVRELWDMPCNNELTGNFPFMGVPFRSLLITTPVCALYVICRWAILAEDVVSLRALPASAFETVNWSQYLPWL